MRGKGKRDDEGEGERERRGGGIKFVKKGIPPPPPRSPHGTQGVLSDMTPSLQTTTATARL